VTNRSVYRWIADDIETIVWLGGNKSYLFLVNDVEGARLFENMVREDHGYGFWQLARYNMGLWGQNFGHKK